MSSPSRRVESPLAFFLRDYRPYLWHALLLSVVSNLLALAPMMYMLQVMDRVMSSRSNETLFMLTILVLLLLGFTAKLDSLRGQLLLQLGQAFQARLQPVIIGGALTLQRGQRVYRHGLTDLEVLARFMAGSGVRAVFDLPWIPFYLIVLYLFHPILAGVTVGAALLLAGLNLLEDRVTHAAQRVSTQRQREAADCLSEAQENLESVCAMGMQGRVVERWNHLYGQYRRLTLQSSRSYAWIGATTRFAKNAVTVVGLFAAAYLTLNVEGITNGVMIASTMVMGRAMGPIMASIDGWRLFNEARLAWQNMDDFLHAHGQVEKVMNMPRPKGRIQVERLLYVLGKDHAILNGIHFELSPGEALGVMGSNASGKTTLVRLLVGLNEPSDGYVRLDGVNVSQWARADLGQHIGYLPQDIQLFSGTVAENIARLGDPHESTEEVIAAAKRTGIHDMILRLPKGYDTPVGEQGSALSGGQRQLIGLARALFGNPALVVLDEPNSALDGGAELWLKQALVNLKAAGITVVLVSHKPSLLQVTDKMLVLQRGKQSAFGDTGRVLSRLRRQRPNVPVAVGKAAG